MQELEVDEAKADDVVSALIKSIDNKGPSLEDEDAVGTSALVGGAEGHGMGVLLKSKDATISALRMQLAAEARKRKALEDQITALEVELASKISLMEAAKIVLSSEGP